MNARSSQAWTPVLSADGIHYCSPACGGMTYCRKSWYDEAVRVSAEMAKRLGPGWIAEPFENLGWHAKAVNGEHQVHANFDRRWGELPGGGWPILSYSAFLNSHKQFVATAATPEDALGFAVQDARTHIERLRADLDALLGLSS